MFRIDVTDYKTTAKTPDGKPVEVPYGVRDSMATVLLNPQQKLNGTALLRSNMIAEKILKAGESVLLEDAEYQTLRNSADTTVGFDRQDVELVRRIMDAPRIEVKEATDDNA